MCTLCAVTHVGNFFGSEIAIDEILLGSEVGESSNWLDVDACVAREKKAITRDASVTCGERCDAAGQLCH